MTARKSSTKSRAKKTTTRTATATAKALDTAPAAAEGKKRRSATPRKRRGTATSVPDPEPLLTQVAPVLSHAHIAHEAFLIWEASGRPHGQQLAHWLEAEQRLKTTATCAA